MIETRHLKSVVIFNQTILWRILKPSLKNIDEVPQKSLRMAAGHIFIDISESIQHQGFLGIILSLWEISFINLNLSKPFCSGGLNLSYKQSKVEYLFV